MLVSDEHASGRATRANLVRGLSTSIRTDRALTLARRSLSKLHWPLRGRGILVRQMLMFFRLFLFLAHTNSQCDPECPCAVGLVDWAPSRARPRRAAHKSGLVSLHADDGSCEQFAPTKRLPGGRHTRQPASLGRITPARGPKLGSLVLAPIHLARPLTRRQFDVLMHAFKSNIYRAQESRACQVFLHLDLFVSACKRASRGAREMDELDGALMVRAMPCTQMMSSPAGSEINSQECRWIR